MPQSQSSHSLGDLPTQGGEQTPAQAAHEETEAEHAREQAERAQQAQFEQQRNLLSHSEALIRQGQHLAAIQSLSAQFGGRTVDISAATVTIELTGKSERIDAFLSLVRPYGMLEAARSGKSCCLGRRFESSGTVALIVLSPPWPQAPWSCPARPSLSTRPTWTRLRPTPTSWTPHSFRPVKVRPSPSPKTAPSTDASVVLPSYRRLLSLPDRMVPLCRA